MNTQSAFVSGWLSALFIQPDVPKPKTSHCPKRLTRQTDVQGFDDIVEQAIDKATLQVAGNRLAIAELQRLSSEQRRSMYRPFRKSHRLSKSPLSSLLHYESKQS